MEVSQPRSPSASQSAVEEELVKCYCCGLTEECTPEYIATVKEQHQGFWICGLCAEAIKDENSRSHRGLSDEEAMKRHASFCDEFRLSSPPAKSAEELISAMKQLLRRTLNSLKKEGLGCQPALSRSKSFFVSVAKAQAD
ncbi:unnamed protein product [Prunus armeniaca]|uniref:DUF1677 domain-containing protein n=1 Tax=Prunus armeniaca TaxID=36596 RepID=A0A6J5W4D0_PRUAR|nr:hypothetical protein GBA52_001810 [Prunus armeniaca]CAB4265880.1 unnamed protein product [Prunus armeniaca]CAB4296470.1 unnamed protein product [Prunus armeniaca]